MFGIWILTVVNASHPQTLRCFTPSNLNVIHVGHATSCIFFHATFHAYSDKLAHVQVVINCQYSVAQMCTREDTLTHNLGALYIADVMSYNMLTTEG